MRWDVNTTYANQRVQAAYLSRIHHARLYLYFHRAVSLSLSLVPPLNKIHLPCSIIIYFQFDHDLYNNPINQFTSHILFKILLQFIYQRTCDRITIYDHTVRISLTFHPRWTIVVRINFWQLWFLQYIDNKNYHSTRNSIKHSPFSISTLSTWIATIRCFFI